MMLMRLALPILLLVASAPAAGQSTRFQLPGDGGRSLPWAIDSGPVQAGAAGRGVIFATDVVVSEARWLRIAFGHVDLPGGAWLRLTSLFDGAWQQLTREQLAQWRHASAYFNGGAVRVEIVAGPDDGPCRVSINEVLAGLEPDGIGGVANLCGVADDRVPSVDGRAARIMPAACSAFMIDDCEHCFLTAGHCADAGDPMVLVEFNVPDSHPDGWLIHPPPEFQFAIDPHSVQFDDGGLGFDWAYFGCYPNSNTGLTPFETLGAAFTLADSIPPPIGQLARVTGYGIDQDPTPERNRTQQTHAGPYVGHSTRTVRYEVDTTGGNSGSVVIDESTGLAIGVHTAGACNVFGYNVGTAIVVPELQAALASPRGVCAPPPLWAFEFPQGLSSLVDPDGDTIRVLITGQDDQAPVPGTGLLHLDTGAGYAVTPMTVVGPNLYDAVFPALDCGQVARFFLSAQTVGGATITMPRYPLSDQIFVTAAYGYDATFIDDFETDTGWTVTNSDELTGGAWERGRPDGFGLRGDPAFDADGSGRCFLTENFTGDSDVDDGATTLTSPPLDATDGPQPTISYFRWFTNAWSGGAADDPFVVEISDDDGQSWLPLETVAPDDPDAAGGWIRREFILADVPDLTLTSAMRIRFTVSDLDYPLVVEAAVDDVRLNRVPGGLVCAFACIADCAPDPGDGVVNEQDLAALIGEWGAAGGPCDLSGDGEVNILDLLALLASWGACPAP